MAKSRGQDFEDEFKASIPEGVFVKKLHTPAPPPNQMDLVVAHLRATRPRPPGGGDDWMIGVVSRSAHTPRQGFDMIVAPGIEAVHPYSSEFPNFGAELRDIHGAPVFIEAAPVILFCLEFKATQGKSIRLDRLKPHQEDALRKEALAGRVAGVVVEFSELLPPLPADEPIPEEVPIGDVLFVPILSWLAYKTDAARASLPYDIACRIGLRIEIDADRGRSRRYYKVGAFLRAFGADIPGGAA